jgi:hypothetical protein
MDYKPSKYQQAIYDFVEQNPKRHLIISAAAGSGKTSTLLGISKVIRRTQPEAESIFVAFNKSIATELGERLDGFNARTINSLFFGYYRDRIRYTKLDGNKYWDITRAAIDTFGINDEKGLFASEIKKCVDIFRSTCCDLDDADSIYDVADVYDITYDHRLHKVYKLILEYGTITAITDKKKIASVINGSSSWELKSIHRHYSRRRDNFPCIDFTDQLWVPYTQGWITRDFDNVLCDEQQDLNALQFACLMATKKEDGRYIGCGDEFQAIYLFGGAASDGMRTIATELNAEVLPLSVVYRCPTSHVEMAKAVNPDMESPEWAIEGIIDNFEYDEAIEAIKVKGEQYNGDMLVVSRRNAPLVSLAYSLMARKVSFVLKGRDFGRSIARVVEQIALNTKKDGLKQGFVWENFAQGLMDWYKKEVRILDTKEADKPKYIALQDKYDSIMILFRNSQASDPFGFIEEIENLFPKEQNGVGVITLCSIHKAKGLERQAVFVLEYNKLPFSWKNITQEQAVQENNLLLVALTRSKEYMALVQEQPKDNNDGEGDW